MIKINKTIKFIQKHLIITITVLLICITLISIQINSLYNLNYKNGEKIAKQRLEERWSLYTKGVDSFEKSDFFLSKFDINSPTFAYLRETKNDENDSKPNITALLFTLERINFTEFRLKNKSVYVSYRGVEFEQARDELKSKDVLKDKKSNITSNGFSIGAVEEPTTEQLERNKQVEINNALTDKKFEEAKTVPLEVRIARFKAAIFNFERCTAGEINFKTGGEQYKIKKGKYPDVYDSDKIITKEECDIRKTEIDANIRAKENVKNFEEFGCDPLKECDKKTLSNK